MNSGEHPVLLFDGVCNLCNWIVGFTLKRDRTGLFRFASLQSASGQELLERFGRPRLDLDSYLLIHQGRCLDKSSAGLTTLKMLGWPWRGLYIFIAVPRPLRDLAYDFIARNRYRVFGKRETCMLPSPGIRERFLP